MVKFLYEIHLTVEMINAEKLVKFSELCQSLSAKAVLIELPKGEYRQQPMLTYVFYAQSLEKVWQKLAELNQALADQQFNVIRGKIEIPVNDFLAFNQIYPTHAKYFEWHGKVDYVQTNNLAILQKIATNFNVHLSKNSLKNLANQRFLTYRHNDLYVFNQQILQIENYFSCNKNLPFTLLKSQAECCIFDDKLALDNGWID